MTKQPAETWGTSLAGQQAILTRPPGGMQASMKDSREHTNQQHKPVDVDLRNLGDAHGTAHDDSPDGHSYPGHCH